MFKTSYKKDGSNTQELCGFIIGFIMGSGCEIKDWGDFAYFNTRYNPDWEMWYSKWITQEKSWKGIWIDTD
jgi:hypothetical protein